MALDRKAFTAARADLAYGESASILLYLSETQLLKKFYDAYTAGYQRDPSGRAAMEAVTGKTVQQLQADWVDWLQPRVVQKANFPQEGERGKGFTNLLESVHAVLAFPRDTFVARRD